MTSWWFSQCDQGRLDWSGRIEHSRAQCCPGCPGQSALGGRAIPVSRHQSSHSPPEGLQPAGEGQLQGQGVWTSPPRRKPGVCSYVEF